eukprot:gene12209-15338_t
MGLVARAMEIGESDSLAPAFVLPLDEAPSSGRESQIDDDDLLSVVVPQAIRDRNAAFSASIKGKLILAPLTRGNHLPFRQLCVAMGCDVTMSEMAFGRPLLKMSMPERAFGQPLLK